jgi:RHS repeat-associated protein
MAMLIQAQPIYYVDDYELTTYSNGDSKENIFIYGVDGLDAICNIVNDKEPELYFVSQDHIGSIVAILDKDNRLVNEYSYDAWGRKRSPESWELDLRYLRDMPMTEFSRRGYTKHEQLPEFQLINMNGRMYDPITRQMTSPDILEFDILTTQSYNRFAYSLNNPLKYIDPSGYLPDFPVWVGGYWKNTLVTPKFKNHQYSYPVGALSALGVGISHTHYWINWDGLSFHADETTNETGSNGKSYSPYLKGIAGIPRIPVVVPKALIKSVWVPLKCLNPWVLPY